MIDIGPLEELRTPCLQDTEEHSLEDCRDVALSHAWGNPDETTWGSMMTTVETLAARKEAIDISALPKTFRDTMIACRHLGV